MKLDYTKPTISFQNIALNSGTSVGCKYKSNQLFSVCPIVIPDEGWNGDTIFQDFGSGCRRTPDVYPCYDIPLESSTIVDS